MFLCTSCKSEYIRKSFIQAVIRPFNAITLTLLEINIVLLFGMCCVMSGLKLPWKCDFLQKD